MGESDGVSLEAGVLPGLRERTTARAHPAARSTAAVSWISAGLRSGRRDRTTQSRRLQVEAHGADRSGRRQARVPD